MREGDKLLPSTGYITKKSEPSEDAMGERIVSKFLGNESFYLKKKTLPTKIKKWHMWKAPKKNKGHKNVARGN